MQKMLSNARCWSTQLRIAPRWLPRWKFPDGWIPEKTLWRVELAIAVGFSINATSPVAPAVTTIPPWASVSFLIRNRADYSQARLANRRVACPESLAILGRCRRRLGISCCKPSDTEVTHALDDPKQRMTLLCQPVLHPRWHFRKACPSDDASFFETTQAIRKCLGADSGERPLQLAEASTTGREVTNDQWCPAIADQGSGALDWAASAYKLCHRSPGGRKLLRREPIGERATRDLTCELR